MVYDGSWDGLLTAIFDVFEYKLEPLSVSASASQVALFQDQHVVSTDAAKVKRVSAGLLLKIGKQGMTELWHTFLSELAEAPLLVVRTAVYYFQQGDSVNIHTNYAHDLIIHVKNIVKSVSRERHRMKAFVRFQRLKDDLYLALIEPDFNVLPLIEKHFKDRYADQCWLIYDVKRNYGIHYDKQSLREVTFTEELALNNGNLVDFHNEEESLYTDLWKRYFKSVNIRERKNLKLHIQHVPRRYWRYLHEKSFGLDI